MQPDYAQAGFPDHSYGRNRRLIRTAVVTGRKRLQGDIG